MIDTSTQKPLRVSTAGNAGPYIMVPVDQLESVRNLLDTNEISYWVDEEAVSLDGKPAITVINLGQQTDPKIIQGLLDSVS